MAAGKGTRMKTPLPKVVHPVAGRPMIERVLRAVQGAGAGEVRVVVGFGESLVRAIVEPMGAICFKQESQLGTADAVRAAQPETIAGEGEVMILNGDHPLLEAEDLKRVRQQFRDAKAALAVVTCEVAEPGGLGRVVRQGGKLRAIVEAKDAGPDVLKLREINTGIYMIKANVLRDLLPKISNKNAQGEFYLTDLVSLAVEKNLNIEGILAPIHVGMGVNNQAELAEATGLAFTRKAARLMENGVMMMQPSSVFVEDTVEVGAAAVLYPNVFLRGKTKIGAFSVVETGCVLTDAAIGDNVHIKAGCYVDQAIVAKGTQMGPYAHLRPGTDIGEDCKVGNFVEMKKVKFAKGAKASHLTYLGDAEIGENTNIGCGTITCNYAADHKKYVTKIGKNVFVGSDTQFVAPISIGDNAVIGSGSTITKDVPANALAVARGRQVIRENYVPHAPAAAKKD